MKTRTLSRRGIVIGVLVAIALVVVGGTALSNSAINAQLVRIRSASLLLEAQGLPGLSTERQTATVRAYQSVLRPAWKDLSAAEQFVRVAQMAVSVLAAPATALPTPASFVGNRTAITTSQDAFVLRRETDCSLTMVPASYTLSTTAATALAVQTAGTPVTHYEQTLHDAAGLSTTAGIFAGGCSDSRPGIGSRRTTYLGKTVSTGQVVFAGVGYYPPAGSNALGFGNVNPVTLAISTFQTDVSLPGIEKVASGDLNGDGMSEIVGIDGLAPTISVWRVNPNGTLGTATRYTVAGYQGDGAVVADFNRDGKADVVVSSHDISLHPQISVFLGKGDGTLNAPTSFSVAASAGTSEQMDTLVAADLRGNGRLDLIASNGMVLLGNGDGTFAAATTGFPVVNTTSSFGPNLVAADFNKDGKADVAISGGETVKVFLGAGDGSFTAAGGYASIDSVGYLGATDIDGDGNLDLYVGLSEAGYFGSDQFGAREAYALMGNGDGTFKGAPSTPFVNSGTNVADVNGDGIPDGVGVNADRSLTAYLGNSSGRFTSSASIATAPLNDVDSVAIGDVTGDGSPDVVYIAALNAGSSIFVAAGNGHGGFAAPTMITQPTFVPAGDFDISPKFFNLHLADVNGDGKLDLVYGFSDISVNTGLFFVGNAIQRGNGNGTFNAPQTIPYYSSQTTTSRTAKVALIADLNRDSKPDLVIMSQTAQVSSTLGSLVAQMQVAIGNGDGTFRTPATVAGPDLMASPFTAIAYIPVVAADMNGDGIVDLVSLGCSNTASLQVSVAIGNGDGTYRSPNLKTLSAQYLSGQGLGVADFDGDGKLDVVVTNRFGLYSSGIFLGNGDGTLQSTGESGSVYANQNFVLSVGGATTILDVNGDGKPDVLAGSTMLVSQAASTGGSGADFALSTNATSGTVGAGSSATTTITLTPSNGFNQSVALTCSGLPAGATCGFAPASVAVNGSAATSTLTISTTARVATNSAPINPAYPGGALMASFAFFVFRRRDMRPTRTMPVMAVVLLGTLMLGGCGGSSSGSGGGAGGTPAGTYTLTITGTAGSTTHALAYVLTVN